MISVALPSVTLRNSRAQLKKRRVALLSPGWNKDLSRNWINVAPALINSSAYRTMAQTGSGCLAKLKKSMMGYSGGKGMLLVYKG